jgi:hypothetical protein
MDFLTFKIGRLMSSPYYGGGITDRKRLRHAKPNTVYTKLAKTEEQRRRPEETPQESVSGLRPWKRLWDSVKHDEGGNIRCTDSRDAET